MSFGISTAIETRAYKSDGLPHSKLPNRFMKILIHTELLGDKWNGRTGRRASQKQGCKKWRHGVSRSLQYQDLSGIASRPIYLLFI